MTAATFPSVRVPHPRPASTIDWAGGARLHAALLCVTLPLTVSVVPWRTGALFEGGLDPVVVGKALVAFVALGAALLIRHLSPVHRPLGARSAGLLLAITAVAAVGALDDGARTASLVLTVRLLLLAATLVLLATTVPARALLTSVLSASGTVAVVSAASGAVLGDGGRLAGGIPEMASNVLAGLAAPPLVALIVTITRRGLRPHTGLAAAVLTGIVIATGSRTTLLVVVLAVGAIVMLTPRVHVTAVATAIIAAPAVFAVFAFTDAIDDTITRGQSVDELATLSSRTVAWEAVLSTPLLSWQKWVGSGLAVKTVAVQERWRDEQVLDSSWVSIIAQAGLIGTIILLAWVVVTVAESLRRRHLTALTLPLLIVVLGRSVTENGLIESSPTLVVFLAVALALETGHRADAQPRARYRLAAPDAVIPRWAPASATNTPLGTVARTERPTPPEVTR